MTDRQAQTIRRLQDRLRTERNFTRDLRTSGFEGGISTEVNGVTIFIGPSGGIEVPALRSYADAFEAAVNADILFRQQRERDDSYPLRAEAFKTGHFNPRVDPATARCSGDRKCPACE